MNPVARTALWIADSRARETERPDRLFADPFARALAGSGAEISRAMSGGADAYLPIRVRYFDDLLGRRAAEGLTQIVLLAAGLDCRAFRSDWPAGTRLFELDQPEVFAYKEPILRSLGAAPRCARATVAVDLREPWLAPLAAAGYDAARPAFFLLEGLLPYLAPDDVAALLRACHAAAAPGSRLACDLPNLAMLRSEWTVPFMKRLAEMGSPWLFGCDDPEQLLADAGWRAEVTQVGSPAANFGRWPYPVLPRGTAGIPGSFFVEGERAG